jgi:hypothetical protein
LPPHIEHVKTVLPTADLAADISQPQDPVMVLRGVGMDELLF